ncbi:MAG: pyridoxine 5'-phosphate synthase [Candidatus Margulisiibacteriota bacterium]
MKLGINIDHIATLRQARMESIPDPVEAAKECLAGGADGIVCHLREDRRHIQDEDVKKLRALKTRLDLEMAATDEMVRFALKLKPDLVTLVPEKRAELTTEGGLDVKKHSKKLKIIVDKLQDKGIPVSLFIDPEKKQVEESAVVRAKFIEIHTGMYANAKKADKRALELEKVGIAVQQARLIGLRVNAGHGLNYQNVGDIIKIAGVEELNIGFSIIVRAVFIGLKNAVREMKGAIK